MAPAVRPDGSTPYAVRSRRGPGAGRWFLFVLLLLPVAELAVILWVARQIGGWPTVGLLVAGSALGLWLVTHEGRRAWALLGEEVRTGEGARTGDGPTARLTDSPLVLTGGLLLLVPGFLTDILGLLFVLPLTRSLARDLLFRAAARGLFGVRIVAAGSATQWSTTGSATQWSTTGPGDGDVAGENPPRSTASGMVIEGEVVDPSRSEDTWPSGPGEGEDNGP